LIAEIGIRETLGRTDGIARYSVRKIPFQTGDPSPRINLASARVNNNLYVRVRIFGFLIKNSLFATTSTGLLGL